MADGKRNTTPLLHGAQTKQLFDETAGLANAGVANQDRREATIERPDLLGTAENAANRIQNDRAALIRGEQANVTPKSNEQSKEKDDFAEKKTPKWTDRYRVG